MGYALNGNKQKVASREYFRCDGNFISFLNAENCIIIIAPVTYIKCSYLEKFCIICHT